MHRWGKSCRMVGMNGTKTYSVVFGEGDFLGLDSPAFSFERDGASESFFFCGSGVRGDISFSCDCGEDVLSVPRFVDFLHKMLFVAPLSGIVGGCVRIFCGGAEIPLEKSRIPSLGMDFDFSSAPENEVSFLRSLILRVDFGNPSALDDVVIAEIVNVGLHFFEKAHPDSARKNESSPRLFRLALKTLGSVFARGGKRRISKQDEAKCESLLRAVSSASGAILPLVEDFALRVFPFFAGERAFGSGSDPLLSVFRDCDSERAVAFVNGAFRLFMNEWGGVLVRDPLYFRKRKVVLCDKFVSEPYFLKFCEDVESPSGKDFQEKRALLSPTECLSSGIAFTPEEITGFVFAGGEFDVSAVEKLPFDECAQVMKKIASRSAVADEWLNSHGFPSNEFSKSIKIRDVALRGISAVVNKVAEPFRVVCDVSPNERHFRATGDPTRATITLWCGRNVAALDVGSDADSWCVGFGKFLSVFCDGKSTRGEIESVAAAENIGFGTFSRFSVELPPSGIELFASEIGTDAFKGYRGESFVVPPCVKSICRGAFRGSSLRSLAVPSSVVEIGNDAFSETLLEKIELDAKIRVLHVLFSGSNNLREIKIPDSVVWIRRLAFEGCSSLRSVVIPQSVKWIDEDIFLGCNNIESVDVSGNKNFCVKDGIVFDKKRERIVSVFGSGFDFSVPRRLLSVSGYTFRDRDISSVSFPDTPRFVSVSDFAFASCRIGKISLSPSVLFGGPNVFGGCSIEKIRVNPSCKGAFLYGNVLVDSSMRRVLAVESGAREVEVPPCVDEIGGDGESPFLACSSLESVVVPERFGFSSVRILPRAFSGLSALREFSVRAENSCVEICDGAFENCGNLEMVTFGEGILDIRASSFRACSRLRSVVLPQKTRAIGARAFAECTALEGIRIPPEVVYIGSGAFSSCTNLRELTIDSERVEIADDAFDGCVNMKRLKIRKGSSAERWAEKLGTFDEL